MAVQVHAPTNPGSYQGIWQFLNADGRAFGIRVTARIIVAAPQPSPGLSITASALDINAGDSVTIQAAVQNVQAAWVNGRPVTNNSYQEIGEALRRHDVHAGCLACER